MSDTVLLLAQTFGHRDAYEGGKTVGQITFYVMLGVIVIWGLPKLLRRILRR